MTQTPPGSDATPPPGTPRWVKIFAIITLVLVVLIGLALLSGDHGPGRHLPSGDAGDQAPAPRAVGNNTPGNDPQTGDRADHGPPEAPH